MRYYFLFIVNALANLYVLLFMWGFSAGPANMVPVIALFGGLMLFGIAGAVLLFNSAAGIILGLICSIALLPFEIGYVSYLFKDGNLSIAAVSFILPAIVNLLSIVLCLHTLLQNRVRLIHIDLPISAKVILSSIPLALFITYCLLLYL